MPVAKKAAKKSVKKVVSSRRPTYELFAEALRGGRVLKVSQLEAVAKKNGVSNFANRFYWFRRSNASKLGLKAVYDKEKGTIRLVSKGKSKAKK